jgi:hypothetical protein
VEEEVVDGDLMRCNKFLRGVVVVKFYRKGRCKNIFSSI